MGYCSRLLPPIYHHPIFILLQEWSRFALFCSGSVTNTFKMTEHREDVTGTSSSDDIVLSDSTKCPSCLLGYGTGVSREARILHCGHTFCEACLEQARQWTAIKCPACDISTPLEGLSASTLPKNYALESLHSGTRQTSAHSSYSYDSGNAEV